MPFHGQKNGLAGHAEPRRVNLCCCGGYSLVVNHQGPMDELRLNPVNALANVRSFKNHIRGMKGFQKCEIRVFPADPSELPEDLFRKAYGQQLPVQCQVDEVAVRFLRDILPARDTHASIRGMCGKPGLQHFQGMSGSSGGSLVQAFQELKNMLNNGQAQAAEVTLLPPRKHKKLLALEGGDGTASAGSAAAFDMATGASPDSAAKDLAKLEPEKHEQATQPAEALPEVEETEVQEKPGKSQKNVDEMADEIMGVLGGKPPAAKAKAKGKAKASSKKAAAKKPPAAKKQPAVAHEKAEEPSSKKSKATSFSWRRSWRANSILQRDNLLVPKVHVLQSEAGGGEEGQSFLLEGGWRQANVGPGEAACFGCCCVKARLTQSACRGYSPADINHIAPLAKKGTHEFSHTA